MTDLQELMALLSKATPGEWEDGPPAYARVRRDPEKQKRAITTPNAPVMANAYGSANAKAIAATINFLRSPAFAEMARNDARYRYLRDMKCCTFSLSRDEGHAINYEKFESFAEASPEWYVNVPADELQKMRETNTDWALQIYPDTPIGFYVWHAATLDTAVDAAIDAQRHGRGEKPE